MNTEALDIAQFGRVLHARPTARRTLIAFTGLAGSGKSTAALHLVERHGYVRLRFAGPLKAMMAALGLSPRQIDGALKETPCELLCGKTPRLAMQTIGTEWGRNIIGEDLWTRAWRAAFDRLPPSALAVVDDCRFPNEAEAVRAAGGMIVRIDRPGSGAGAAGHASEGQDIPSDRTIRNEGRLSDFLAEVDALARDMTWARAALTA